MSKTSIIALCSFLFIHLGVSGQPGLTFDIKKPPKFENRTLGSEKTGKKKFTVPRRFLQNTVTHYNYFFNANNRLNEVIARAKGSARDDYSQLLPFYNYTLQATSGFKNDLDSVIYKSTTGVLIHDLRNDWIDNLYLLIGKAYYLRNDLDSAYLTFQYVNYAFSPKEKDGYDKVIGSNENNGSNAFSISTRERTGIPEKVFSRPPSRNESFIWQVKTFLARDEFAEAASMIETLKNDPLFPDRLQTDLEEVQAYSFYKQQLYDSAAFHLEKCLSNATDRQELARWEYLIAQLYERTGKSDLAEKFYNKTIHDAMDPVMEVYARVNAVRQNKSGDEKSIQQAVDALVHMARKDRYESYRDIIYYHASGVELERNNTDAAKALLVKSIQFNTTNAVQKSKSYMALGNISFDQKQYSAAKSYYDSIFIQAMPPLEAIVLNARKAALQKIVQQTDILERQDSLQRIAALPTEERNAFVKKLYKKILKQQGIKEEPGEGANANFINGSNAAPPDLFESTSAKGDWYFYNPTAKGKGFSEFKAKWGNRPNVDNWRRQAAIAQNAPMPQFAENSPRIALPGAPQPVSLEGLLNNLPVTPEKLKMSNDSVESALFYAGKAFMNGLEDYTSAIAMYEKLLNLFPATAFSEETLFNLYYCYKKAGLPSGEAQVRQALAQKFPNGKFNTLLKTPNRALTPDSIQKVKATRQYESIYNQFIEGSFREALASKKQADSIYGQTYWTPQLLYIEAVYYIKQREDSTAKEVLRKIMQFFPSNRMSYKASNLIAVLNRRGEIESYLTKLDVKRPEEEAAVVINNNPPAKQPAVITPKPEPEPVAAEPVAKDAKAATIKAGNVPDAKKGIRIIAGVPSKADSLRLSRQASLAVEEAIAASEQPQKEARSATVKNNNTPDPKPGVQINMPVPGKADSLRLSAQASLAVEEAIAASEQPQKEARSATVTSSNPAEKTAGIGVKAPVPGKADSLQTVRQDPNANDAPPAIAKDPVVKADSAVAKNTDHPAKPVRTDSVATIKKAPDSVAVVHKARVVNALFSDNPSEPHYVLLELDKVDPVYVSEARNAFSRYHRERYTGSNIQVASLPYTDDIKLILFDHFENEAVAMDYLDKTSKLAPLEIIPWLTANKYSLLIISQSNLEVLKNKKNITEYRKFLGQLYPGRF